MAEDAGDALRFELLQGEDARAREERADHLERRVLGGRPVVEDVAGLDAGEEGVLLGLVEPVDLVDEDDRPAAGRAPVRQAPDMNVLVVVPTYNERDNLPVLVPAVLARDGYRMLVVDDGSPDGTGELADELAAGRRAAAALGGGAPTIRAVAGELKLPGHVLVIVPRMQPTPDGFPREPGVRKRRPW